MLDAEQIEQVINATDVVGSRIIMICVPTRGIRVLMLEDERTFRVEQLMPFTWVWRTLATHVGDNPWESYLTAALDANTKQEILLTKLRKAKIEKNQADRAAAAAIRIPDIQ